MWIYILPNIILILNLHASRILIWYTYTIAELPHVRARNCPVKHPEGMLALLRTCVSLWVCLYVYQDVSSTYVWTVSASERVWVAFLLDEVMCFDACLVYSCIVLHSCIVMPACCTHVLWCLLAALMYCDACLLHSCIVIPQVDNPEEFLKRAARQLESEEDAKKN